MRAFLFISAILGFSVSWSNDTASQECRGCKDCLYSLDMEELEDDWGEDDVNPIHRFHYLISVRTCLEDMSQVIITLVIEHYRIDHDLSDGFSTFGVLNIAWCMFSMLKKLISFMHALICQTNQNGHVMK